MAMLRRKAASAKQEPWDYHVTVAPGRLPRAEIGSKASFVWYRMTEDETGKNIRGLRFDVRFERGLSSEARHRLSACSLERQFEYGWPAVQRERALPFVVPYSHAQKARLISRRQARDEYDGAAIASWPAPLGPANPHCQLSDCTVR